MKFPAWMPAIVVALLDAGILTQEEFDAKKKQLLGL